jgi:bifunctional non-homologous end joining protein LigD
LQLVKDDDQALIWSKNGKDITHRFRDLARAVAELPCRSCIIDAEGVAPNAQGNPDFRALVGGQSHKMGVCFDLLEIDGRDMRPFPLVTRRVRLSALLRKAHSLNARLRQDDILIFSYAFPDPLRLLADLDERGLEGIVSKKADQPYVSGRNRGWIKVKCHAWRAANAWRGELFRK